MQPLQTLVALVCIQLNGEIIGVTADKIIVSRSQPKLYISLGSLRVRIGVIKTQAQVVSQAVIKIDSVSFIFFKSLKIGCIRMNRSFRD